jgi:HD superfamily phosphohydrolase
MPNKRGASSSTEPTIGGVRIIDPLYEPVDPLAFRIEGWDEAGKELNELYKELTQTPEVQRLRWLNQAMLLPTIFQASTHTRFAHAVGCWRLGYYALEDIQVYDSGGKLPLGKWLLERHGNNEGRDLIKAFMAALLLHDIGHPPFSHVLEFEPHIEPYFDHQTITYSLISGKEVQEENWHELFKYFLTTSKMPLEFMDEKSWKKQYGEVKKELKFCPDVLNKGIDQHVLCILQGKCRCNDNKLRDTYNILHQLIDGEIDMDRIDHVLRDSYFIGIRLAEYRVREFFQNIKIITPKAGKIEGIKVSEITIYDSNESPNPNQYLRENNSSIIVITEEGKPYIEYLLVARMLIGERALWIPRNLFMMGVLKQGAHLAVSMDPILKRLIPFLTDQLFLQIFREPLLKEAGVDFYEELIRNPDKWSGNKLQWFNLKTELEKRNCELRHLEEEDFKNYKGKILEVYKQAEKTNSIVFSKNPRCLNELGHREWLLGVRIYGIDEEGKRAIWPFGRKFLEKHLVDWMRGYEDMYSAITYVWSKDRGNILKPLQNWLKRVNNDKSK